MQLQSMRSHPVWRRVKLGARVAFSCAAMAWVLHRTPLHSIVAALGNADIPLLAIGLVLNFMARLASAERTLAVSRGLGLWITRWQTIETLFISNFYALVSPGPVLSGVVTVYRYHGYGATMRGSVGALLCSRAVECALFVAMGSLCVIADPRVHLADVRYPLLWAGVGLGIAAIVMIVWRRLGKPEFLGRWPKAALRAGIPATVQVILSGAAVEYLAGALGIHVSLLTAIWITAAVYAVVLLPISVAGVGIREVTLTGALGLLGLDPSVSVALSFLMFLDPLINALLGGLLQLRSSVVRVQPPA